MGFEPTTPTLAGLCSAPELHPRCAGRAFELPSDRPLTGEPAGGARASRGPSKLPPTFAVGHPLFSVAYSPKAPQKWLERA